MDTQQRLNPLEAWDDFYLNFKCEGNTPNEIVLAEYTRRGKKISGKVKNLGERRIKRLLEKYAPGKYQFHEAHFTKEPHPNGVKFKAGLEKLWSMPDNE